MVLHFVAIGGKMFKIVLCWMLLHVVQMGTFSWTLSIQEGHIRVTSILQVYSVPLYRRSDSTTLSKFALTMHPSCQVQVMMWCNHGHICTFKDVQLIVWTFCYKIRVRKNRWKFFRRKLASFASLGIIISLKPFSGSCSQTLPYVCMWRPVLQIDRLF
jgi:hypothetical protein